MRKGNSRMHFFMPLCIRLTMKIYVYLTQSEYHKDFLSEWFQSCQQKIHFAYLKSFTCDYIRLVLLKVTEIYISLFNIIILF